MNRKNAERLARLLIAGVLLALPIVVFAAPQLQARTGGVRTVDIHARMAESGGWTPSDLSMTVGERLRLRLTSDDVMHGFAIGQSSMSPVDVKPGQVTEIDLTFDHPGEYTYYCTRWCGPNHWRMRGTIVVTGPEAQATPAQAASPLYVQLGLNIDAPHPAAVTPAELPSATRGAALGVRIPAEYLSQPYYRAHSPAQIWSDLRAASFTRSLTDGQVWDLVALIARDDTTPEALSAAAGLYAQNCAACHGETGKGDGVMAASAASVAAQPAGGMDTPDMTGRMLKSPANFTDAAQMLGASPAVLQGKILRGGMGTGMPYWGPILTDEQTWALVAYVQMLTLDPSH